MTSPYRPTGILFRRYVRFFREALRCFRALRVAGRGFTGANNERVLALFLRSVGEGNELGLLLTLIGVT